MTSAPDTLSSLADLLAPPTETGRWHREARPDQLEPDGAWLIWLILAGRGWGKTRTGAEWVADQARANPGNTYAVVAPTFADLRNTCFEGRSGLLAALGLTVDSEAYNRSTAQVRLPNGSTIIGYAAETPGRIRGANLAGAWCDEIAQWRYEAAWYEGLVPALRIGDRPRIVATTTPRPVPIVRDLLGRDDGTVHTTRGSTFDNAANLSAAALVELKRRYEGSRLGRQELYGEVIDDVEGALWTFDLIHGARITEPPEELSRIVVAIDPAVTSGEDSDETGIVVAGKDNQGHGYVLGDYSMRGTPIEWAKKALWCLDEFKANYIVAEVNNGQEIIETVMRQLRPTVPYKAVNASRGKKTRAEPVSIMYEQRRIHHVGTFADLESQMCNWVPDDPKSPDRMDALVWAFTELMPPGGLSQFLTQWNDEYGSPTPLVAPPQFGQEPAYPAAS